MSAPSAADARSTSVERELARLASRQHGVVARTQLLALGFGRGAIGARLRSGRLSRVHAGVYLVGHVARARLATKMAAVLACGTGAVVSHLTAGVLWALVGPRTGQVAVDVTVAGTWAPSRDRVRVHRVGRLEPRDVTRMEGLPITTPARTLLDLASAFTVAELETAAAQARRRYGVGSVSLADQLERNHGRPGVPTLRALLESGERPALVRSKAERRLLALLRRSGCPNPEANQRIAGYEVDLLWRHQRLVLEFDGYEFHADRAAFERDRQRDAELQARGFRVIRVTWRQLVGEPATLVDRVIRALDRARVGG